MMRNKEQWEVKKLGEVFDLQMGKTPSRDNMTYWNGEYPWLSIADIKNKYINSSKEYITEAAIKETGIKLVKADTVIMSFKLTIGRTAIATVPLYTNEAIMSFNAKEGYSFNTTYLYYYLSAYKWGEGSRAVMGTTLNKKIISNSKIMIPPLSVQSSIVSELDLLSGVIEKKKQQLAELDNLAHAIFHDMFGDPVNNEKGWEVKKLGEVCNNKGSYGAASPSAPKDLKRPRYIRITDIDDNGELNDDFVVSADEDDDKAYLLKEGDLLFARSGATVGKTYLYQCKEPQIYAGYLIKFSINTDLVNPLFAFCITKTNGYKKWIKGQASGAAQPNVNAQKYGSLPIPLPPLPLQQLFATKIASIENQKGKIKQSLAEAETFFQSRMSYYFD